MRRTLSALLAVVLAASSFLGGCGKGGGAGKVAAPPKPKSPYTLEYELTEENIDSFIANDTVETAMTGGPFYPGAQALPGQDTAAYDAARAKKVDEIKAEAAEVVKACDAAKPALTEMRSEYIAYLNTVYKEEPKAKDAALETVKQVGLLGIKEVLAEQQYAAMAEQETTQTYAASMRDYLAVTKALEMGGIYLEDANLIAGYSAVMIAGYGTSTKAPVTAATTEFNGKMEKLYGDVAAALNPVAQHIANVDLGLKQLASADHYMTLEAMGFMAAEQTKLKPLVDGLTVREGVSAEDVQAIKDFYAAFEEWNASMQEHVASISTTDLIAVKDNPFPSFGPEVAYAAGYDPGAMASSGGQILATPADAEDPPKGWLESGWNVVSSGFGKLKTGVGVAVDTVGLGVKNISTVGAGIYYGNSKKEIIEGIMSNTKEVVDNYNKGLSGSSTFKTGTEYIEGVETGAGENAGGATEWGLKKIFGKGTISSTGGWAVNGLTKITVGMFTGLAKGIYKVADKSSSSADVATGMIEIALGAIGGSKIFIKASQIPGLLKGTGEGAKAFAKTVKTLIGTAANNAESKKIAAELAAALIKKGMSKDAAMKLISNSIKMEINTAVGALIKNSREAMIKKIKDLIAKGGTGFLTNFKSTVKGSLEDMVKKGYKEGMAGWLERGTKVIGENMTDYVDNLVAAGIADGYVMELINLVFSMPPDPEQLTGSWNGSITITKVDIPASEKKTAEEANCEQTFKQLEGKRNAATYVIKMGPSGSGTVKLSGGTGQGSGTAKYSGGSITMVINSSGSVYTLTGKVAFDKKSGGMVMSGSWRAPFQKSKIIMSGVFQAAK